MSESKAEIVWWECEKNYFRIAHTVTLTGIGVGLIVGIANGLLTSLGWFYSFVVGLYVVPLPFVGYQVVTWLLEQQKPRGQILWDFGARPERAAMMVMTSLMLLANIVLLVAEFTSREPAPEEYISPLAGLLVWGILSLSFAGRLQFCSTGIWAYRRLLPWDELECFEWKSAGDWKKSALWLKHRHPRVGPVKQVFVFPDADKERVEELLHQHLLSASEEVEAEAEAQPV